MFIYRAILDQVKTGVPYCPLDTSTVGEVTPVVTPIETTAPYCPLDYNNICYEFYTAIPPTIIGTDSILWLDADDNTTITLNGNNVSQWNDKSSSANHATQVNTIYQPLYVTNGFNRRNSVDFNSDYMDLTTNITDIAVRTVFAVISRDATNRNVFSFGTGANYPLAIGCLSSNFYTSDLNNYLYASIPDTLTFQGCDVFNNDNGIMYLNGSVQSTFSLGLGTISTPYFDRIGARNTTRSIGKIMELIYFDSALSQTNRELIEGYLAYKWAIKDLLPSGHPYYSTLPPGVTLTPFCRDLDV